MSLTKRVGKKEKNLSLRIKSKTSLGQLGKKRWRFRKREEMPEKINSAKKYKKEVGESGKGRTTERRSEVANKGNFTSSMPLSYQ